MCGGSLSGYKTAFNLLYRLLVLVIVLVIVIEKSIWMLGTIFVSPCPQVEKIDYDDEHDYEHEHAKLLNERS